MDVSSDESCNRVTVVLPMFGVVSLRNRLQLGRPNEHVGVKDYGGHWDQTHHGVVVGHVLEFVILPSENETFFFTKTYEENVREIV